MTRARPIALLLAVAICISLAPALAAQTTPPDRPQVLPAGSEAQAPSYTNPFPTTDILDLHEQPFDSSVLGEKPFMLNIWASWCSPCVEEMPALNALSAQYADDITIVGLLGDAVLAEADGTLTLRQDELAGARQLYERLEIAYPSLIPNELMVMLLSAARLQYYPTSLFFDARGELLRMEVGSKDEAGWQTVIEEVLAQTRGSAPLAP